MMALGGKTLCVILLLQFLIAVIFTPRVNQQKTGENLRQHINIKGLSSGADPRFCLKNLNVTVQCPEPYKTLTFDCRVYCYQFINHTDVCQDPTNVNFNETLQIYPHFPERKTIWAPLQRRDEPPYSPFLWTEPFNTYGVAKDIQLKSFEIDYKCAVFTPPSDIFPEKCTNEHSRLCIRKLTLPVNEDPCQLLHFEDYIECTVANLKGDSCYCVSKGENLCPQFAEPENYQLQILRDFFDRSQLFNSCAVANDGNLEVETSKFSTMDAIMPCNLCQLQVESLEASITIVFDDTSRKLKISIDSPSAIYLNYFFCFAESSAPPGPLRYFDRYTKDLEIEPITAFPDYHWCEFFLYPSMRLVKSNKIVAFNRGYIHGMIVEIEAPIDTSKISLINSNPYFYIQDYKVGSEHRMIYSKINSIDISSSKIRYCYRINRLDSTLELSISEEMSQILEELEAAFPNQVTDLKSSEVCPRTETTNNGVNLKFPETPIGSWAYPEKFCFQNNDQAIKRFCGGNIVNGGSWEDITGNCTNFDTSSATHDLYNLLSGPGESFLPQNFNEKLNRIVKEAKFEMTPIDVHLVAKIFDQIGSSGIMIDYTFAETVSNLMEMDNNVLKDSQLIYNATDNILSDIDQLLVLKDEEFTITLPFLLIHGIKCGRGIVGVVVKGNSDENFTTYQPAPLHRNNYSEILEAEDFIVALVLPELHENSTVFLSVFFNDTLFNEEVNSNLNGIIVSVVVKNGITGKLKIYFKQFQTGDCVYWKYGNDPSSIKGSWAFSGDPIRLNDEISICETDHVTHFGMLIDDKFIDNKPLEIITIFGSVLSAIGVCIIFLTATIFKSWRKNPTNKVILNISTCLLLLIVLLFTSAYIDKGFICGIVGALLHYVLLVMFFWMLMISFSNYRRLYLNLHYHMEDVLFRYCVFCWGFPFLLVGAIYVIAPEAYDKISNQHLCYPSGIYLKIGVLIPVGVILTITVAIFTLIVCRVREAQPRLRKHVTVARSASKSMILLFFMTGLTWLAGLISAFTEQIIFDYIFCLLSTFHGFVIFVYYILDTSDTREIWSNFFKKHFKIAIVKRRSIDQETDTETVKY